MHERKTMTTKKENEKPADPREARTPPQGGEPYEPEAAAHSDGSDHREAVERGYGWGV